MGYYTSYQDPVTGSIYCDQTSSVCTSFTDSLTRTVCTEINPISCSGGCTTAVINNGLILCNTDSSWNCNLCPNDLEYYNPVKEDDVLSFQFQQNDIVNTIGKLPSFISGWGAACDVFLRECCTGEVMEVGGSPQSLTAYTSNYFVGQYYNPVQNQSASTWFKPIQAIEIPISTPILNDFHAQFPNSNCFYFQFDFFLDGNAVTLFSEPYRLENCKDTLIIESKYRKFDCNGYYYGDITNRTALLGGTPYIGNPFFYSNQIRVPAYLELKSFTEKKDFFGNLNFTKMSQLIENYKFTTNRIPIKVATLLANIMAGEEVYIGNGTFYSDGEITKNNDTGNQWFMEADLKRTNCTTTFTCN